MAAHLIPDSADKDDDKVYFFFTERASEAGEREGETAIHTRIGRVCAVSSVKDIKMFKVWLHKKRSVHDHNIPFKCKNYDVLEPFLLFNNLQMMLRLEHVQVYKNLNDVSLQEGKRPQHVHTLPS